MTELHRRGRAAWAYWKAIRSQAGAFDLPSIITGVVVVGILAAGVLAAIFGVIPFAQDNAAKQDLDSIRTAEGVAKARLNGFKDKAGLLDNGLISGERNTVGVGTDATGSCYVGISKSATGNVYFNSDRTTQPAILTVGVDTGCIDAATRDVIIDGIGGFGPAGPVAGGPTDTDGDGIPDSEDPTPNGGGSGGVITASTWSPKRTITNVYPDPGFKNGIGGWTGDVGNFVNYTDDAATTVDYIGSGYNGDAGALRITATGSTNRDRATAYFPIDVSNVKDFSFQISTPDGTWHPSASWYAGVMYTDMSGNYIGAGSNVNATRAGGLGANVWERFDAPNNFGTPPQPHKTYLFIQADHIPVGGTISMLVDRIFVSGDACGWDCAAPSSPSVAGYQPNFDGSYPSSAEWTYSWTGAENASPSTAVAPRAIAAPTTANVGDTIQIKGEGFDANSTVTPAVFLQGAPGGDSEDILAAPVQTDGSGRFDTTVLIPASTRTWNWKIGVVEDTSYARVLEIAISTPPGTGASATTPPGPWSDPVAGSTEQFSAPTAITIGSDFTVMGKGYAPFTEVYVYTDDWNSYVEAYTDNNGYFAVTMNIPSWEAVPGPGGISVEGNEDIRTDVTFQ